MSQGVVIKQFHRHRRRELLRWLEQTYQQYGAQEFVDHPIADLQLLKQRQCINRVVLPEHRITAVEIQHGNEQPGNAEPIGDR